MPRKSHEGFRLLFLPSPLLLRQLQYSARENHFSGDCTRGPAKPDISGLMASRNLQIAR